MNYEQFYYWLKGYMDCTDHNSDILFQEAKEAIKENMKSVPQQKVLSTNQFVWPSQGIVPLTNNCS